MLVRVFLQLGCQQLQLNSLSLETLLDAKVHPVKHKNLIVRVWGWSGNFCELQLPNIRITSSPASISSELNVTFDEESLTFGVMCG